MYTESKQCDIFLCRKACIFLNLLWLYGHVVLMHFFYQRCSSFGNTTLAKFGSSVLKKHTCAIRIYQNLKIHQWLQRGSYYIKLIFWCTVIRIIFTVSVLSWDDLLLHFLTLSKPMRYACWAHQFHWGCIPIYGQSQERGHMDGKRLAGARLLHSSVLCLGLGPFHTGALAVKRRYFQQHFTVFLLRFSPASGG